MGHQLWKAEACMGDAVFLQCFPELCRTVGIPVLGYDAYLQKVNLLTSMSKMLIDWVLKVSVMRECSESANGIDKLFCILNFLG
jgi:hypothetical protein